MTTILGRFTTTEERAKNPRVIYIYEDAVYRVTANLVLAHGHGDVLCWDVRVGKGKNSARFRKVTDPNLTEADLRDKQRGPTYRAKLEMFIADKIQHHAVVLEETSDSAEAATTVGRVCDLYRAHLLPKQAADYRRGMAWGLKNIESLWGRDFPLSRIDQAAVDSLAEKIRATHPTKPSLPRQFLHRWSNACGQLHKTVRIGALRVRALSDNPMSGITLPEANPNAKQPELTAEEFARMLEHALQAGTDWFPAFLRFTWTWGRRRNEVRQLIKSDFLLTPEEVESTCRRLRGWNPTSAKNAAKAWKHGAIVWLAANRKGDKKVKASGDDHVLPLTAEQRALVDSHLATLKGSDPWLFAGKGGEIISAKHLTRLFAMTAKAAGLDFVGERYGFHSIRRTVRARLHAAQMEPLDVNVVMGWSGGMTETEAATRTNEHYLRRRAQILPLFDLVHALDFVPPTNADEYVPRFAPREEMRAA